MGMMIIVNTARNSGLFEYIAIITAKKAGGSPLRVLILFAVVTAVVSAFLDNVTTVLLLTPNIMIGSAAGLSFNEFLITLGPIMAINPVVVLGVLILIYGRVLRVDPDRRTAIARTFETLDERAAIRDRVLFNKSVVTILLVVGMFFIHDALGLEPALVALTGASFLLFWSRESPEAIFEKIEWPGLFVVGALVETGTIAALANMVVNTVHSTGEAILVIAWFAAIASAVVDNIPLTATLIP